MSPPNLTKKLSQLKSFWYNWNNINLNKNGSSTLLTSLLVGVSGEHDKVVRALDDLFNYLRDKAPGTNLLNSLLAWTSREYVHWTPFYFLDL